LKETRERLRFKPRLLELAQGVLSTIRAKEEAGVETIFVGIHARRGDKLSVWRRSGAAKHILGKVEPAFFRHSMRMMKERHGGRGKRVVFIVTSDNPGWARNHLGRRNDTFFPGSFIAAPPDGPTALGVDLALLSLCSHTIMDYGTFGLWGGLLAGGEILAPTGYTRAHRDTPDLVWWRSAGLPGLTLVDVRKLDTGN